MSSSKTIFESYPGGKSANGTYHKIINLIPPHHTYIEPYLGGGAILRNKRLATKTIGNELSSRIYDLWKKHPFFLDGESSLYNMDAVELLDFLNPDPGTFVYLDPPYPMESRSTSQEVYDCETSEDLHRHILEYLVTVEFDCMISTYPNDYYAEMLKDWTVYEYQAMTRGGVATELLYMNYKAPTELHDYQYLGKDCWERQAIKRKINGKIAQLKKLPILEQRAIIQGLNQQFG